MNNTQRERKEVRRGRTPGKRATARAALQAPRACLDFFTHLFDTTGFTPRVK